MKKELKRVPIEKVLLYTLAGVGVVAAVALAPGIGPALKLFGFGKRKYPTKYINNAVGRLEQRGLILFKDTKNGRFIRLTEKGRNQLEKYKNKEIFIHKPTKWDGKWRLVVFDIPERKRKIRDKLRNSLINFGFLKLQDSVWVYPYDCEELIMMLKSELKVGKDILYVIAEKIEYDSNFRSNFEL